MYSSDKNFRINLTLSVILAFVLQSSLEAQQTRRMSFNFKNTPLSSALLDVAKQSDVEIIFGDDLVRNKTVSLTATNLGLEEALSLLLNNTRLSYNRIAPTQLVLFETKGQHLSIVGRVVDADSRVPLPNANVESNENGIGTAANQYGRFILQNVPARICTLTVSHVGYKALRRTFSPDTLKSTLEIRLETIALTGHEVTVKANDNRFFDTSTNRIGQTSVSARHLSLLPAIVEEDPISSLRYLPGIDDHVLSENDLIFDGITVFYPTHASGFLNVLNRDVIQDIQVYRDHYPLRYFGNNSGITQVTGKSASYNEFRTKADVSSIAGTLTLEIPVRKNVSALVSARRSMRQSPLLHLYRRSSLAGFSSLFNVTSVTFYDFVSKLSFMPTGKDVLSSTFLHTGDIAEFSVIEERSFKNTGLSTQWFHQWHQMFSSVTSFAYSGYQVNAPEVALKKYEFLQENTWIISPKHEMTFGLNLAYFDDRHVGTSEGLASQTYGMASVFLQHSWKVLPKFTPTFGIRTLVGSMEDNPYSDYSLEDQYYPEPRLSLKWQPVSHLTIQGAFGNSNQFVNDGSFFEIPAKSDYQILDVNYEAPGLAMAIQVGRRSEVRNAPDIWDQIGDAKIISLYGKYQQSRFTYWVAYQYLSAERLERKEEVLAGIQNGFVGGHSVKLATNYARSGWNVSVMWGLQTALPYSVRQLVNALSPGGEFRIWRQTGDGSLEYLPTRHSLDLSLNKSVDIGGIGSRLGLSLYNLYNHDNVGSRYDVGEFSNMLLLPDFTVAFNLSFELY